MGDRESTRGRVAPKPSSSARPTSTTRTSIPRRSSAGGRPRLRGARPRPNLAARMARPPLELPSPHPAHGRETVWRSSQGPPASGAIPTHRPCSAACAAGSAVARQPHRRCPPRRTRAAPAGRILPWKRTTSLTAAEGACETPGRTKQPTSRVARRHLGHIRCPATPARPAAGFRSGAIPRRSPPPLRPGRPVPNLRGTFPGSGIKVT